MDRLEIKNAWLRLSDDEESKVEEFSNKYMNFIDFCKTERLCVKEIVNQSKKCGFLDLAYIISKGIKLEKGMKVYSNYKDKAVALFAIGEKKLEDGFKMIGAHIDSPRIDLKPNPFYEDSNLALMKTHYYGGIKKYQWATIPLSLYGVAYNSDAEKMEVSIGDNEGDPVFFINDLLIHLSSDQMQLKASEVIKGEQLNVLVGSRPLRLDSEGKEQKNAFKNKVFEILKEKYKLDEKSFLTAEFELVPSGKSREVGFDKSMIMAYGHDDRVCAYSALRAVLDLDSHEYTSCAVFADKEEVGSQGNTGMQSKFFENMIAELIDLESGYSGLKLRRAFSNAKVLSADVNCGLDPTFSEVSDKNNTALIGNGVVLTKYTGSRGKSGCNDANSEFMFEVSKIFDDNNVVWQTGELGKVDQGGGGTVAYIIANYGAEVIDCGTPVLSMHAPYEIVSKVDIYMTYKAYLNFLR
ncbi:MAG: aminopeptidase [Proteocatella sp.]